MAIRKPSVSVEEAKRLARLRPESGDSQDPSYNKAALQESGTAPMPAGDTVQSPENFSSVAFTRPNPPLELSPPQAAVLSGDKPDDRPSPVSPIAPSAPSFTGRMFPETEPAEPKTQMFLSAPLPATGVSVNYDRLSQQYPAAKALQMILRRALDDYEARLDDGSYRASATEYPIRDEGKPVVVQTSRMVPVRLIDTARAYFDPLGFESTRAFGRKFACAALASFFEKERKRK